MTTPPKNPPLPPQPVVDTPPTATTTTLITTSPGVIYVDYKKKKKKRERYSSELKTLQKVERGHSKSLHRLSNAVARGLSVYRKRREKSASRKKDGAIREGALNWSKALSKALRVASEAPSDVAVEINRTKLPRRFRNSLRMMTPGMFR